MSDAVGREAVLRAVRDRFSQAGIETAALDARILFELATGLDAARVLSDPAEAVSAETCRQLDDLVDRRLAGEPVSRIAGQREFWGLPFELGAETLDPRADSETLVEAALEVLEAVPSPRILDLGTGTGCLLLALLSERTDANGVGTDLAAGAVDVARRNAVRLNLADRARFQIGSWDDGLEETFDLIVSNPPYIASGDIGGLAREVRGYDPVRALDGGADGLAAYREIARRAENRLVGGGFLVLELGFDQYETVPRLFVGTDFGPPFFRKDLSGVKRALLFQKN